MLRGKHGARLEFLRKRSLPNLPEDKPGVREDVVKDWNHIHETVRIVSKNVSPCNLLKGERSWSAWNRWRDRRPDFCRCKWQVYGAVSARFVQIFLFFHFELTCKFKDRAPAPFAPQAWPTSWRTIWRCSQILRSATLSRLSKASSSISHFVYSIIPLWPGWPREVIDSESLNKILSSLDGEWHEWILCLSC